MADAPRALAPALVFVGAVVAVISSLGAPLVPAIATATGASLPTAQWSLTVTLLLGAVATPVIGRLGDGPARRPVVLTVLGVVTAGCVLSASPLGLGWLLAGRGLQGVGLGLTPVAIAVARAVLPEDRSRSTAAALSITVLAGVGLGYPLAGLVAEVGGVSAAFWAGAAVSALALLAAAVVLPASPATERRRLDLAGAALLGAGLATGLVALSEGAGWGWTSPRLLLLAGGSAAALAGWVAWSLRTADPLVDVRLARGRLPATAHVTALSAGVANYLVISSVTVLAQTPEQADGFDTSIVAAGLLLLPFSVGSVLGGRVTGALDRRSRSLVALPLGLFVQGAALASFGLLRTDLWHLAVVTALTGVGAGMAFAGLPAVIVSAVPAGEIGSAVGLNQVLRYAGFAVGSALTASVLTAATPAGAALPDAGGYTVIAAIGAGICGAAAAVTWALPRVRAGGSEPVGTEGRPVP